MLATVARVAERFPASEPAAAALAAEACRLAWRPARVRVLLLAESHMATTAADLGWTVRLPTGVDWPGPTGYVRHLYCAGYGEPELLRGGTGATPLGGTPHYWQLMAIAAAVSWADVRRTGTATGARMVAKAALLARLREAGVWLTDASLLALARPGGERCGAAQIRLALRESWRRYHADRLPALSPALVLVIGTAVAAALAEVLDRAFPGRWRAVPQPNGARSPAARAALWTAVAKACAAD